MALSRQTKGTVYLVSGLVLLSYGDSAILYSRWDHAANAHIIPVFHPWAIVAGVLLLFQCWRMRDKTTAGKVAEKGTSSEVLGIGRTRKIRR
jgi:hypothetical protein